MKAEKNRGPFNNQSSEGEEVYVLGIGNFQIRDGRRVWLQPPPPEYYWENRNNEWPR